MIGGTLRAIQVARTALRHLILPALAGRTSPARAERAQLALEALGGTWVKLGQALALRFDVLPEDYCVQFFELLNQVRPFPAAEARRVVEAELGRPLDQLFASFVDTPVAAASIGQVHRATLPDGTVVAVKVQRPGIRRLVRSDIRIMGWLAGLLDAIPFATPSHARSLVAEFARWTEEELDYRTEARHASVLRRNAGGDALERNPRMFASHTTSRVLTMEYVEGVPVIDVITAIRRNDRAFLDAFAAAGHDTRRIASHIVWNALNQIYRFGYFHADPHPANLIVLEGDAIGYVDFGIVGKLDDQTTDSLRYFAQCLFAGHVGKAVDEFMRFLTPSHRTDLGAARRDLVEAMRSYLESSRVGPEGLALSDDIFEIAMLTVVRRHAMALEPDAVRYLKAVLTAEAMVKELDPDLDLQAHENRFFGRLMQLELRESLAPRELAQTLLDARFRFDRILESLETLSETPSQLVAVAQGVRRRVQWGSVLTIATWLVALVALWGSSETGQVVLGWRWSHLALGGALITVALLVFLVIQVRRLPSADDAVQRRRTPRRAR